VDETRSAENQNSTVATSSESTPPEVDRVKKTDDLLAALENVWSADLSSFVITDIFAQSSIHATLFGAQHRFYSAQKKGNVFYVQDQITFRDVSLIRKNQPEEQVDKITIDAETFFFSSGANGYIIRIFVPAFSGRADAFAWIRSWLAGLQIPLD
jgi:hypothetical protein